MKYLILILFCVSLYSQNDTITIKKPLLLQPYQVEEIYKGLKKCEHYRFIAKENEVIAFNLHDIIKQQNDSLKTFIKRLETRDSELYTLQQQKINAVREIERLKTTKTKWYRSPLLWGGIGLITGILITK